MIKFAILIATKNRLSDLQFTLKKVSELLTRNDLECIICDDGSTDGTADFLRDNFPKIKLIRHNVSKGYIVSRNELLAMTTADYAISLDDDAHFLSENPLEEIALHFDENQSCGLIAFRLLWRKTPIENTISIAIAEPVKSFVGCGHVWRMKAWRDIPNYPEWFVFYGEEDFSSYQLLKKNWAVHYLPTVLVQHRVDMKARKSDADFVIRLHRSLRAGWYLYFLFLPKRKIPRQFASSIWWQLKKVFKGNFKVLKAIALAFKDLVVAMPKIIMHSNRLSADEYKNYRKLAETKIFWEPEK